MQSPNGDIISLLIQSRPEKRTIGFVTGTLQQVVKAKPKGTACHGIEECVHAR